MRFPTLHGPTLRAAPRLCLALLALGPSSAIAAAPAGGVAFPSTDCAGLGPGEPAALDVAFADHLRVRLVDGRLISEVNPAENTALQAFQHEVERRVGPLEPTFAGREAAVRAVLGRAASRAGRPQPDLLGLFTVRAPAGALLQLADSRAAAQQAGLLAYSFLRRTQPRPPGDLGSPTPDFEERQGYLEPDEGVDARAAWALGYRGQGVALADVEYGWNLDHEDLAGRGAVVEAGQSIPAFVFEYGWDDHGTAVIGELAGEDNGYGVTGIAHQSPLSLYPEWTDEDPDRRVRAILSAIDDHVEGDVVLLEMQLGVVCEGCYGPAELDPSVWRVVRTGVDAGLVFVAAAGNGGEDLDGPDYAVYRSRGDSGAILVGAGSSDADHDALSFSTHGAGVSLQGWGQDVFTTGYGWYVSVDDSEDQAYIASFSGTSSASPIVAGAAALAQSAAIALLGAPLSPEDLRAALISTGQPQGSGAPIGPSPDVLAFIRSIDGDLDGVAGPDWGGDDCDDADPKAKPGGVEVWYDGIDGDCLGGDDYDKDGDGVIFGEDCDEDDPTVGVCKAGGGPAPLGCSAASSRSGGLALLALGLLARRARRRDRGPGAA